MVTATATISEAMATAVRLSDFTTLRDAMRPDNPQNLPITFPARGARSAVPAGASMAKPTTTPEVAPKLTTMLFPGMSRTTLLTKSTMKPTAAANQTVKRVFISSPDLESAPR